MVDRIADDADLAVDELKRKARRRLVGAIVLALAAAVILPLLLEKEPKPLGDDVSVQIPPVDEGRFVNRLTPSGTTRSASKSDAKALPKGAAAKTDSTPAPPSASTANAPASAANPPASTADATSPAAPPEASVPPPAAASNVPPPRKSVSEAEQRVLAGSGRAAAPSKTEAPAAVATAAAPPAPAPSPRTAATPAAAPTPIPAAAPATATPPAAAATASGEGFAVQIAAFTDDKGANALVAKLKKAGYASTYTEPVETSRGTLWRVRVGGYATRPDADNVRAKLKADGWNGIVVATK